MKLRKIIFRDFPTTLGFLILTALLLFMCLGPLVTPFDPYEINLADKLKPPSSIHWLGTDEMGRDLFARMAVGAWYSMGIALAVVVGATIVGVIIGGISGYVGGKIDQIVMRICDVFMAFPQVFLAMIIATTCGAGIGATVFALAVSWWPSYARVVRGMVISLKETLYVESARSIGMHPAQIIFEIIMPQTLTMLIPQITMGIGNALIMASGFSFLGLGAQVPMPEWGAMISAGTKYLFKAPWYCLIPGIFITVSVLGFSLFGDTMQEITNPALRNL